MAALATALGADSLALRILRTEDRDEMLWLGAVLERAERIAEGRDSALASKIASDVGRLFKR